jgi:hypothetical protein
MNEQNAVKNSTNPAVGIKDESAIRDFLLRRGVQAFQLQAAFIPLSTELAWPVTEAEFSKETRSERRTEDIRKKQWIQHMNRFTYSDNPHLLSWDEMKQIEFITFKKYLLFHPLEDFLEATKDYDLPYMNGESDE